MIRLNESFRLVHMHSMEDDSGCNKYNVFNCKVEMYYRKCITLCAVLGILHCNGNWWIVLPVVQRQNKVKYDIVCVCIYFLLTESHIHCVLCIPK